MSATVVDEQIEALAHCMDAGCPGYVQQPVTALRTVVETTFQEQGGDLSGVEKSQEYLRFADAEDCPCSFCGRDRQLSRQERPEYMKVSMPAAAGQAPGLDPQVAKLMADQAAAVARLEQQVKGAEG